MSGNEDIPVTLKMTLKAKNLLIEEYPLSSKYISFDGEHWWFKGNVKELAGVGRFTLGLADQITVTDTPVLKDYIRRFAQEHILNC